MSKIIYAKLLELQKSLQIVKQDGEGKNYTYASGKQILGIARPKMDELGLLLLQEIVDSEHQHVEWRVSSGTKQQTFSHVKFKFTWVDVGSGDTLPLSFEADGFNDWDKAIGSAFTYAERYFFLKMFHIPTDELDPDKRIESEPKNADDDKRKCISNWLLEMEGGDKEKAMKTLEKLTSFEADDKENPGKKKIVKGVSSTGELREKRLATVFDIVQKKYKAFKEKK